MRTKELTKLIVGGVIGIGILAYVWIAPIYLWLKVVFAILGIWEAWTLINKDKEDTISEAIAELAGMTQLIPLLFGAVYGYALGAGLIVDPIVASALAGLLAHFFFSMKQRQVEVAIEAAKQEENQANFRSPGNGVISVEGKEGK